MDAISAITNGALNSLPTFALPWLLLQFQTFLLVLVRLSGMTIVGPVLGQSSVPVNVRVLLVVSLALMVTPNVSHLAERGFREQDRNQDGWLQPEEQRQPADELQIELSSLSFADYIRPGPSLASLPDLVWVAINELVLGVMLGLGAMSVLAGLQLAGQVIDQQSGLGMGEVFNPDMNSNASISGEMLFLWGTVLFVLAQPFGGAVQMVGAMLGTFEIMPPGKALVGASAAATLQDLISMSLIIGLKIAAPIIVLMGLVDIAMNFLSKTAPQLNMQSVGYGVRATLAMLFLIATLTNTGDFIVVSTQSALIRLRTELLRGA